MFRSEYFMFARSSLDKIKIPHYNSLWIYLTLDASYFGENGDVSLDVWKWHFWHEIFLSLSSSSYFVMIRDWIHRAGSIFRWWLYAFVYFEAWRLVSTISNLFVQSVSVRSSDEWVYNIGLTCLFLVIWSTLWLYSKISSESLHFQTGLWRYWQFGISKY